MVATIARIDELLDRALAVSTAGATEALYLGQDSALTRFATNRIHQNVREHDATLQVRVVDRERIGAQAIWLDCSTVRCRGNRPRSCGSWPGRISAEPKRGWSNSGGLAERSPTST